MKYYLAILKDQKYLISGCVGDEQASSVTSGQATDNTSTSNRGMNNRDNISEFALENTKKRVRYPSKWTTKEYL